MPTPIPSADDGGSHPWRARLASPSATRFAIWRFLLAVAALPPLLAFMAAASWLAWMCFRGVIGPPGAVIALAGITALAALIRRHTGMEVGLALCLIAVVGLVAVVWVVFALLAVALVAGG
jgi:nitrate reductase NapE component